MAEENTSIIFQSLCESLKLNADEKFVFSEVLQGKKYAGIAKDLNKSESAVKKIMVGLLRKNGVGTKADLLKKIYNTSFLQKSEND